MESSKNKPDGVVRKGTWTKEEDVLLKGCIDKYGEGKWHLVPVRAGLKRCRKSCRLRWLNYLRPNIKRGQFTKDEIDLIIRLHNLLGNRWSLIAGRLPGRTANDIKNFWNTHMEKKMIARRKTADNTTNITIRPRAYSLTESRVSNCPRPCPRETGKIHDDKLQKNCSEGMGASSETGEMDECIRWWSDLLQQTSSENGDAITTGPFSFPVDQIVDNPTQIAWTSD